MSEDKAKNDTDRLLARALEQLDDMRREGNTANADRLFYVVEGVVEALLGEARCKALREEWDRWR